MKNKIICIYCMGDYGLETYFKLLEKGVKADFFADRDSVKHGYALDGLYCKSYEELLQEEREKVILIVAIKKPEALISHFRQKGFPNVYDKETAVELLAGDKSPMKKEPLRKIEQIEQMKLEIQELLYKNGKAMPGKMQEIMQDYEIRHAAIKR